MDENDLIPALFSYATEHWVKVTIDGKEYSFKYIPLSLREKINIGRRIDAEGDEASALNNKLAEFCKTMLRKAYGPEMDINTIPYSWLLKIYEAIMLDAMSIRRDLEEFYSKNKTEKLDSPKHKANKLDSLVSICISMKESNLTLGDLADMDETSLFCLMIYNDEMVTRESNAYHNAKAK